MKKIYNLNYNGIYGYVWENWLFEKCYGIIAWENLSEGHFYINCQRLFWKSVIISKMAMGNSNWKLFRKFQKMAEIINKKRHIFNMCFILYHIS